MYTDSSIDKIREADIVKTVLHFVNDLKKKGTTYEACSPFVDEKTPSFKVSPVKQIFKCFSSGLGGDGIKFVQLYQKTDFYDAIQIIASIHSIALEQKEESASAKTARLAIQNLNEYVSTVSDIYRKNYVSLQQDHWSKKMIADRGYSIDIQNEFQIGYSLLEDQISRHSQNHANFDNAKKIGLVKTKESRSYDFFKARLMFPIINHRGKVVGFGGRRSNKEEDLDFPKYLNSPESALFDKSNVLYGLWQAKQAIATKGHAILTEGYTDVIAMHQNSCDTTIATLGTALTEQHLKLLKRYCKHLIILRDADKAGQKAAVKDLNLALEHGFSVDVCTLPEGEDPDSFSQSIDDMDAWVHRHKQNGIFWYAKLIFNESQIIRDNYQNDIDFEVEQYKSEYKLISQELIDIDDLKDAAEIKIAKINNRNVEKQLKDLKSTHEKDLNKIPKIDSRKKSSALIELCKVLFKVKNEAERSDYIKDLAKITEYSPGTFKLEVGKLEKEATDKKTNAKGEYKSAKKNLPEGADPAEYNEYGFVSINNTYHFENSNGNFFQGSDFTANPLYHIQGRKENKRILELVNDAGKRRLVDFDSGLFAEFTRFRKELYNLGGFRFKIENGFRTEHFERFIGRYDREFEPAKELLSMGQNKLNFWAFSNGVIYNDQFIKVNKYGIVRLENVNENVETTEYNDNIENYYSPSHSVMHKTNDNEDDPYENDRFFVYQQSPISLIEWQKQLVKVFGENGKIGVLYTFASVYRDLFMHHLRNFPILGCFGEKNSGKSTFGEILQTFFYKYSLKALDISRSTPVGFSNRVSRSYNTIIALDEYSDNNVDSKIQQGIMGAYGGLGREKGIDPGTKRTTNDKINSSVVVMGQWLPQIFDNALATRIIALMFPTKKYSVEEKQNFGKLIEVMNAGVSSLIQDLVKHRVYFNQQLPIVNNEVTRMLIKSLEDEEYEQRVFEGVTKLLVTYKILSDKGIEFPFTEEEITELCKRAIIENSQQISDSNGVNQFWNILEWLYEHNRLKEGLQFKIETPLKPIKVTIGKDTTEVDVSSGDQYLFLRLSSIHQDYVKEASTRDKVDVINEVTLRNYFKNRSYFEGKVEQKKFSGKNTSALVFNYTKMMRQNIVNFERNAGADIPEPSATPSPTGNTSKEEDDFPF